jgi:hypothetical protein
MTIELNTESAVGSPAQGQEGTAATTPKWQIALANAAAPVVGGIIFLIVWEGLVAAVGGYRQALW